MRQIFLYILAVIMLFLMFLVCSMSIVSCAPKIKYIKVPLTTPPERYYPATNGMETMHEILLEYRGAIMKISEWEDFAVVNKLYSNSSAFSNSSSSSKESK